MVSLITGIFIESWHLLLEMAPYLLFGFFIAGVLHITVPAEKISQHLSKRTSGSVIRAALLGIPLPLCSCGVIPVATHLHKQGASNGAVLSFLIATPTTGVDSIFATYSLLGLIFTVFRVIAAFFSGIFAGLFVNSLEKRKTISVPPAKGECIMCPTEGVHKHSLLEKIHWMFEYAFSDLVADVGSWLLIGILIGGAISYLVPTTFIEQYVGSPVLGYLLMIAFGVPLYVCASGSIPIGAALIMKGLSPGAVLVFLICGPATNTTTIAVIGKLMGKKTLVIYLGAIILCAVVSGVILDQIWIHTGKNVSLFTAGHELVPDAIKIISSIIILVLILRAYILKRRKSCDVH